MEIPKAFDKVTLWFHQDFDIIETPMPEYITTPISQLDQAERRELKLFLDELLSGRHGVEELQRIWFESSADIHFHSDEGLREILRMMRSLCDKT